MKLIITESKYERVKTIIKKSVNDVGLAETLNRYQLPIDSLDNLLEKGNGEYFSPRQLNSILFYYVIVRESLPYKLEHNSYIIYLEHLNTSPNLYADISIIKHKYGGSNRYGINGAITLNFPMHSKNSRYVVTLNWYSKGDWRQYDAFSTYYELDDYSQTYTFDFPKISSMKELKDWYLNVLPQDIIKASEKFIEYVEKEEEEKL